MERGFLMVPRPRLVPCGYRPVLQYSEVRIEARNTFLITVPKRKSGCASSNTMQAFYPLQYDPLKLALPYSTLLGASGTKHQRPAMSTSIETILRSYPL